VTHYEKAPIAEALIDIQFKGPETTPVELLELQSREGASYPERKPLFFAAVRFEGTQVDQPPGITTHPSTQRGWAFLTADKLQLWQVRVDGFTFSRLAPYQSWPPFRDEALRLWQISKTVCKPESVTRVAVRYINRLELPLPLKDFKDYLLTVPEVSPHLPQGLSNYFMQLQIPQEDIKAMLVLNQQLVTPNLDPPPRTVSVILDIDLFRAQELPQDEHGLWSFLQELHDKKNEIFEACITDLTRELIK
jgi:uncharacterized protein (TIGR04255 family)